MPGGHMEDAIHEFLAEMAGEEITAKRRALEGLRRMTRICEENRNIVANCNKQRPAIPALLELLCCADPEAKQHAMAVIFNLSINLNLKESLASLDAIKCISEVAKNRGNTESAQIAASTLCSLACLDKNKAKMGAAGAVDALAAMLCVPYPRPALSALSELLIYKGNKAMAVRAGAVPSLLALLHQPHEVPEIADAAVGVLALLATHREGKEAIAGDANAIRGFVDTIRGRCMQSKENAALILLEMFDHDPQIIKRADEQHHIFDLLTHLSIHGSAAARHRATRLLKRMMEAEVASYTNPDSDQVDSC